MNDDPDSLIYWQCHLYKAEDYENHSLSDFDCNSYIERDTVLLQVNPKTEYIKDYGEVTTFQEQNGLVNVHFRSKSLTPGMDFNFTVTCHSDNETISYLAQGVTPKYRDLVFALDREIWIKDNTGYIVGSIVILIVISIILWFAWDVTLRDIYVQWKRSRRR